MEVEWFRSATVGLKSKAGTAILCDPWLTDGAFLGSWYHFPPLEGGEFDEVASRRWDAVYISHLHADHFDRKFMATLARKQPWCQVLIPAFAHDWLLRAVEKCGFAAERVVRLESGAEHALGDFSVRILTADHCNPEVCGLSTPCHNQDPRLAAIDSLAIFEADGNRLLNANDALAIASVGKLLPEIGPIDVLLGHYGGAGPFPQCFPEINDYEKVRKAQLVAESFLSRLASAAQSTKARFVMPFAGQYCLAGRLSSLNSFRSVVSLSEAATWINENSDSQAIAIKPFTSFDVGSGAHEHPWIEPDQDETNKYIKKISKVTFPYEKAPMHWETAERDLADALESVAQEYRRRVQGGLYFAPYRVSIETSVVSGFLDTDGVNTWVHTGSLDEMLPDETRISCHPNLLKGLIVRAQGYEGFTPMHFNQAEIGSHFEWRRNGDYNPVIACLNFLQTNRVRKLAAV